MKNKLLTNLSVTSFLKLPGLILLVLMMLQLNLFAQNVTVKGTVTSNNGATLPGVNVILKGTIVGTTTDVNGKYSVSLPSASTLVFSFLGYEKVEVPVDGRTTIDVTLVESVKNLGEVVVVGYGSQKKKDLTGSVSVVSNKELENRPQTQFGNLLEGKAAGVQIIRSSGQPQAGFSLRIRGTSSITSGSEPLYIVDGVQTYNTNEINPDDIESFTILKDASSAAIYGSSGANGVVLITTKRGKNQKLRLDLNASMMMSQAWKRMKVLNGTQFQQLATEMDASTDWEKYNANTDWQKEVFRNAITQNYQLSATGGTKNTGYYFSFARVDQEGIVLNNTVKRNTFKANIDQQVTKFLKLGTSLSYDNWKDVDVSEGNRNGVITRLYTSIPNIGIRDKDNPEMYARSPFINDLENPVSTVYQPEHLYKNGRFHGNVFAEAKLMEGLKVKSLYGFEKSSGEYTSFQDSVQTRYGKSLGGIAAKNTYDYKYWVSENTANYDKVVGDHTIAAMAGFIVSRENTDNVYRSSHDFSTALNGDQSVDGGAVKNPDIPYKAQKSHVAYIGRVNYSYKNKYIFTTNFRADGSGQFSPQHRWGYFPSFSAGWRISQEDFLKDVSAIDDLKFRVGWGIVGNDRAQPYAWYGIVDTISAKYLLGGITHTAFTPSTLENKDLRWEKTKQLDIGIDLALLESRLMFTLDYYYKKTTDLLLEVPQPTSTGFPTALQNAGSLENKGFEFMVSSRNFVRDDFKWSTDFNISFNRNKVLNIIGNTIHSGGINPAGDDFNTAVVQEGKPLGSFYGKISQGVDPATGMINFMKTADGSADSIGIIGNANPDYIFGLTNSFTYKRFQLDIFIQGVQGNQIMNATRVLTESMALVMNQSATVENRWKHEGDITDMPKVTPNDWSNSNPSTRYLEDGSYIRVKSLTLTYNINPASLSMKHIPHFSVYLTSENLLTFTKYSGFDPEVSTFSSNNQDATNQNTALGVDYGTYPQSRDFMLGVKVSF
ncbi:MAG: TonB-dependent receptor [Bacteroidetes bacterium]|nr:TonB-dependent receptor [Bacteroidota bacterium]